MSMSDPDDALTASHDVRQFATAMMEAEEVHRTILDETLDAADSGDIRESGRTACGNLETLERPIARFPEAVELSSCPRQVTGTWHTHVSAEELHNPQHSLVDIANVAFGFVDASMVVGTETGEILLGSQDRDAMQGVLSEALDTEMDEHADVVRWIEGNSIPSIVSARTEVKEQYGPLVTRVPTGYGDLTDRVPAEGLAMAEPYEQAEVNVYIEDRADDDTQHAPECPDAGRLRQRARGGAQAIRQSASGDGLDLQTLVVSQAVGTIVGTIVERVVFD